MSTNFAIDWIRIAAAARKSRIAMQAERARLTGAAPDAS
jgi:hypothetical protein